RWAGRWELVGGEWKTGIFSKTSFCRCQSQKLGAETIFLLFGLLTCDCQTRASRSAWGNGIGFSSNELIKLKIVVFAPIPRLSVMIATNVTPGFLSNIRAPYRRS